MSTAFKARCEPCDVDGPQILRSASGGAWIKATGTQPSTRTQDMAEWSTFLVDHDPWDGAHELTLERTE